MTDIRTDWARAEIAALFDLPFTELVFRAADCSTARTSISLVASTPLSAETLCEQ